MFRFSRPTLIAIILFAAGVQARAEEAPVRQGGRVVLVDDRMFDAVDTASAARRPAWPSRDDRSAATQPDADAVRVRVKVRPNRAMGRVSLFF